MRAYAWTLVFFLCVHNFSWSYQTEEPYNCLNQNKIKFLNKTLFEENEFKFFLTLKGNICNLVWVSEGEQSFVKVDMDKSLNNLPRDIDTIINGHTHVNSNLNYFTSAGAVYRGEVKFASKEDVDNSKVSIDLIKKYELLALKKNLPLAQMSPPSTQDFYFLYSLSDKVHSSIRESLVVTSGGFWIYSIPAENQKNFQNFLSKVDFLATVFLRANDESTPERLRNQAQRVWEINVDNTKSHAWLDIWKKAALELRKPFSEHAMIQALESQNYEDIFLEYNKKVQVAHSFATLLTKMGAEVRFLPQIY